MNFIWLEDFLALASTGNFSRAADQRHSSQPAFSRRIRALDEWVGVPLVDRSTQPARLTEVGEWFKVQAEALVSRADRLPREARQLAQTQAAALRIACTHALSFTFVPRWLLSLEPLLTLGPVELISDVMERCEAQMQQGKAHFLVGHAHPSARGVLDTPDFVSLAIGDDRLMAVSAPARGQTPRFNLDAAGKSQLPVLAYTEASGLGRITRRVLGSRLASRPSQPVFSAHLASALRSMALEGRGVAWLPQSLVQDDLQAGRLVSASRTPDWHVDLQVRLYRAQAPASRAAQAFWDGVMASLTR